MNPSPKPVQRRLLLPLLLVLSLVIGGFMTALVSVQRTNLERSSRAELEAIGHTLESSIQDQAQGLSAIEDVLLANSRMIAALRDGDRDQLLSDYLPTFEQLRKKYGITHFYFQDRERVNLLRVHQPERHGDLIQRYTTLEAERTQATAAGIELGVMGTLTLRVVCPVMERGELVGYLELGKEIEDILDAIHEEQNVELTAVIDKDPLDQARWESGMGMLGREADWSRYPDHVVIYSSLDTIPEELRPFVEGTSNTSLLGSDVSFAQRSWRVLVHPLFDVSKTRVGELIVSLDTTAMNSESRQILVNSSGISLLLFLGLLAFFNRVLIQTDQSIRRGKRDLIASQGRFDELARQSGSFTWETDKNGCFVFVSPYAKRVLGYDSSNLVGQIDMFDLHPARGRAEFKATVMQCFQDQAALSGLESEVQAKCGSIKWLCMYGLPTLGEEGELLGYRGCSLDVTERVQATSRLELANRELQVQGRLAQQLAADAQAANEAKSDFLANMSHELRTPLNGVLGISALLGETDISEQQQEFVEIIRASGEALLVLINDLLDFSVLEAGEVVLDRHCFDLQPVLDEFTAVMAGKALAKDLSFTLDIEPDVPGRLRGDSQRIIQVLTLLTENAIKFTQAGSVSVKLELQAETKDRITLRVTVRDTGIGIPAQRLSSIFDKFSQIDTSTSRKYDGVGMGLALSNQVVELLGGELGVSSVEAEGSEFWFSVPLGKSTPEASQPQSPSDGTGSCHSLSSAAGDPAKAPLDSTFGEEFAGSKILLAEDNPINQRVALAVLKKLGFSADAVNNGREALSALASTPYDLVLMDCQMPEMDGYEATRQIRDSDSGVLRSDIPILALTAHAMKGDREICLRAGMDDYLTKPIDAEALLGALRRWLPLALQP